MCKEFRERNRCTIFEVDAIVVNLKIKALVNLLQEVESDKSSWGEEAYTKLMENFDEVQDEFQLFSSNFPNNSKQKEFKLYAGKFKKKMESMSKILEPMISAINGIKQPWVDVFEDE